MRVSDPVCESNSPEPPAGAVISSLVELTFRGPGKIHIQCRVTGVTGVTIACKSLDIIDKKCNTDSITIVCEM